MPFTEEQPRPSIATAYINIYVYARVLHVYSCFFLNVMLERFNGVS